jgi:hypothetical protein
MRRSEMRQKAFAQISDDYMIELIMHMGMNYVRSHGKYEKGRVLIHASEVNDVEAMMVYECIVEFAQDNERARVRAELGLDGPVAGERNVSYHGGML